MARGAKKTRRTRNLASPVLDRFSPLLDAEPANSKPVTYTVKAKVWRWKGKGAWYFANLPKAESAEIRKRAATAKRGWGSIRVGVRIGKTQWDTSLFPASKTKTYLFAIKASVREAEEIAEGSMITAHITVR